MGLLGDVQSHSVILRGTEPESSGLEPESQRLPRMGEQRGNAGQRDTVAEDCDLTSTGWFRTKTWSWSQERCDRSPRGVQEARREGEGKGPR